MKNFPILYMAIQGVFIAIMVLVLAFAQIVGASLSMVEILAIFGGVVIVEMIVFGCILGYGFISEKSSGSLPKHARVLLDRQNAEEGK